MSAVTASASRMFMSLASHYARPAMSSAATALAHNRGTVSALSRVHSAATSLTTASASSAASRSSLFVPRSNTIPALPVSTVSNATPVPTTSIVTSIPSSNNISNNTRVTTMSHANESNNNTTTNKGAMMPWLKAYNSLAPLNSFKRQSEWLQSRVQRKNITGAGVIVFDTTSQSVLLFENIERKCFEEPGGFIKDNSDPATSASIELFEESCTTICESKSSFLPDFVDVRGRSSNTTYRGFFMTLDRPVSPIDFIEKRMQLERQGYPEDFFETKGMVFIPVQELAQAVKSLGSASSSFYKTTTYIMVKDRNGINTPVSTRTIKLLKEGGLDVLQRHSPLKFT